MPKSIVSDDLTFLSTSGKSFSNTKVANFIIAMRTTLKQMVKMKFSIEH